MPWFLFKFHVATAVNNSLYEDKQNYTVTFKLQVVEGTEIGKLVENLE